VGEKCATEYSFNTMESIIYVLMHREVF